jgi:hypothetical protein
VRQCTGREGTGAKARRRETTMTSRTDKRMRMRMRMHLPLADSMRFLVEAPCRAEQSRTSAVPVDRDRDRHKAQGAGAKGSPLLSWRRRWRKGLTFVVMAQALAQNVWLRAQNGVATNSQTIYSLILVLGFGAKKREISRGTAAINTTGNNNELAAVAVAVAVE